METGKPPTAILWRQSEALRNQDVVKEMSTRLETMVPSSNMLISDAAQAIDVSSFYMGREIGTSAMAAAPHAKMPLPGVAIHEVSSAAKGK